MVSTRRNPDTDEAVAVPAAAEPSGSLTLNVTDRDSQRDISNAVDVNVANVNNVADISNAAPSIVLRVAKRALKSTLYM
jgi:hypothetical protein